MRTKTNEKKDQSHCHCHHWLPASYSFTRFDLNETYAHVACFAHKHTHTHTRQLNEVQLEINGKHDLLNSESIEMVSRSLLWTDLLYSVVTVAPHTYHIWHVGIFCSKFFLSSLYSTRFDSSDTTFNVFIITQPTTCTICTQPQIVARSCGDRGTCDGRVATNSNQTND